MSGTKGGGTYCKFRRGATGKSSAHMLYIGRESAVQEGRDGVLLRNMPEEVERAESYQELRTNLASYAWAREESEIARHKSRGEVRTHFRTTLSFERDVEIEQAKEMTNEWLEKCFPDTRAAAFFHNDTDHLHGHIWLDARQIDDRKIDLAPRDYRQLDEEWNRIYCREMGKDEREHLDKKQETQDYKRARAQGEEREEPQRAETKTREMYAERERRNAGAKQHDEDRTRRDQPTITERDSHGADRELAASAGEREINNLAETSERAIGILDLALPEIAGLREVIARVGDKERGIDRGIDR
jgi:hypothetical protein